MEGWQQDWAKVLETIAKDVEQFFQDVGRDIADAADVWLNFSEEVAEGIEEALTQLDEAIAPKLDQFDEDMAEWLEPVLQAVLGWEASIDRAVEPMTQTVEPLLNQHPICVGCQHYHGQAYGGNLLVCAMHPYGIVDGSDHCQDKELITWGFPSAHPSDPHNDFNDHF